MSQTGSVRRSHVCFGEPPAVLAGLLRDRRVVAAALARCGHRCPAAPPLLAVDDEIEIDVRLGPGVRVPVRVRVTHAGLDGLATVLVDGPLHTLRHTAALRPVGTGTELVDEISWTAPLGGTLVDGIVRRLLTARSAVLAARARREAPVVVATALVRDGAVLAARRTRPPALAGRWELPGGRVEPGEAEADAVVRECREELGADVLPGVRIGTDLPIEAGVLRVYSATMAPRSPEPAPLEHSALRWVPAGALPGVDWVDADRAVLADLAALLGSG